MTHRKCEKPVVNRCMLTGQDHRRGKPVLDDLAGKEVDMHGKFSTAAEDYVMFRKLNGNEPSGKWRLNTRGFWAPDTTSPANRRLVKNGSKGPLAPIRHQHKKCPWRRHPPLNLTALNGGAVDAVCQRPQAAFQPDQSDINKPLLPVWVNQVFMFQSLPTFEAWHPPGCLWVTDQSQPG